MYIDIVSVYLFLRVEYMNNKWQSNNVAGKSIAQIRWYTKRSFYIVLQILLMYKIAVFLETCKKDVSLMTFMVIVNSTIYLQCL